MNFSYVNLANGLIEVGLVQNITLRLETSVKFDE